jgi:hypothetical protein
MNETRDIVKPILDYCNQVGIFARRRHLGAYLIGNRRVKSPEAGRADLWGILRSGRHFEAEIKKPGEKPSDEQLEWLGDCARVGAVAFWTDSLDGFIKIIEFANKP